MDSHQQLGPPAVTTHALAEEVEQVQTAPMLETAATPMISVRQVSRTPRLARASTETPNRYPVVDEEDSDRNWESEVADVSVVNIRVRKEQRSIPEPIMPTTNEKLEQQQALSSVIINGREKEGEKQATEEEEKEEETVPSTEVEQAQEQPEHKDKTHGVTEQHLQQEKAQGKDQDQEFEGDTEDDVDMFGKEDRLTGETELVWEPKTFPALCGVHIKDL